MKPRKPVQQLYQRVELSGTAIVHDATNVRVLDIVNVSESGILLSKGKGKVFELGKRVSMALKGPHFPQAVRLAGIIVRHQKRQPIGVAVEFVGVSVTARLQLQASVEEVRIESVLNEKRKLC